MSSPTPVTDFDAALEKDWKLVESKESVIDLVAERLKALNHKWSSIYHDSDSELVEYGHVTIMNALANVFLPGREHEKKRRFVNGYARSSYNRRDGVKILSEHMKGEAKKLHEAADDEERKEIHKANFAQAKFAILTVNLHLFQTKKDGISCTVYLDYFRRCDLAAERDMYVTHLRDEGILLDEDWGNLQMELGKVSIWRLGDEINKETRKNAEETSIAKVWDTVNYMEDTEDAAQSARLLLILANFTDDDGTASRDIKNPVSVLKARCEELFKALKGFRGKFIGDLHPGAAKEGAKEGDFKKLMLATWWGLYAAQFFRFDQTVKRTSFEFYREQVTADADKLEKLLFYDQISELVFPHDKLHATRFEVQGMKERAVEERRRKREREMDDPRLDSNKRQRSG